MQKVFFPMLFSLVGLLASAAEMPIQGSRLAGAQFSPRKDSVDNAFQEMLLKLDPPVAHPDIEEFPEIAAPPVPDTITRQIPPVDEMRHTRDEILHSFADRFWNGHIVDLKAALWRMSRIRPAVERILSEEGVPVRFAAIILVESGANAAALSPKSARGLWQLIPETARRYGLVVNERRDDRVDLVRATRAAAEYLRDLHREFGNWQLVLAAYNAGEGAVQDAVGRLHSTSFQVLSARGSLPRETRTYVPAVLAAIGLIDGQNEAMPASVQAVSSTMPTPPATAAFQTVVRPHNAHVD